ncbi:MAG: aspartyl protease family protein [Dehalococcoidia bacterium]
MATVTPEAPAAPHMPRWGEDVGRVTARIRVSNSLDRLGAAPADWGPATDRVADVTGLFDTGATHLCLPASVIARLRLPRRETVVVVTARGISEIGLYDHCELTIDGRSRAVEVLELPEGVEPLIGILPMENMGIAIDVQQQTYALIPTTTRQTYLRQ